MIKYALGDFMEKEELLLAKESLEGFANCFSNANHNGFRTYASAIESMMIKEHNCTKDATMVIGSSLAGKLAQIIWDIKQTGAIYGDTIGGWKIATIIDITNEIIEKIDNKIKELEQVVLNESNNSFIDDVLKLCKIMQGNFTYLNAKENIRNDYVRDMLEYKGYLMKDQTRRSTSSKGNDAGEVDLMVCETSLQNQVIIECENLDSCDTSYILKHYKKIFDYDTLGNNINVLLSYVNVKDFEGFSKSYTDYVKSADIDYKCTEISEVILENTTTIKLFKTKHNRGKDVFIYHILVLFHTK